MQKGKRSLYSLIRLFIFRYMFCCIQKDVIIIKIKDNDYISLTAIAKYKSDEPTAMIANWLRNRKYYFNL